jgi:hypothetical protein
VGAWQATPWQVIDTGHGHFAVRFGSRDRPRSAKRFIYINTINVVDYILGARSLGTKPSFTIHEAPTGIVGAASDPWWGRSHTDHIQFRGYARRVVQGALVILYNGLEGR